MNLIREKRIKKGLTQEQLAEITQIGRVNITRYENGKITIPVSKAKKIASVLGFDWTLLYEDKPSDLAQNGGTKF